MPEDLYFDAQAHGLQRSGIRGLYGTPPAPLPFLSGVVVRAFVLQRPQGNIVIYNAPGLSAAAAQIRALGPLDRLLVNHHHEAMYGAPDLDVPIFVHENDRAQTTLPIAGTFRAQGKIDDDLEILPMPGHTPGATMFLWDTGEHRLLFPGDSIWVQDGDWKAVLLAESDRDSYLDSLARLMEIEFDLLVPWGAEDGAPYGYAVTPTQAKAKLDRIWTRLKAGAHA